MDIQTLREKVEDNLPDYMRGQPDDVQEAYIEYEATKLYWESYPDRYFHFTNKRGEDVAVDTNPVQIRMMVKRLGGTDEQAAAAVEHRNKHALPIIRKLSACKGKIKGIFGTKYSVAIVENADEIVDLFAQFYTVEDIINVMKAKKGYQISATLLKVFYQDNRETIERRKLKFVNSKKDFFIATETGRLQVLNDLLLKWRLKFSEEEKVSYSSEIRKILEQARKECKGEQLFLTVDGKIDINAMIHGQDNVAQALQKLPINMIVVGLVAAKAGLNPATIIGQLASSYYKDHNGYNRNFLDGQNIQLPGDIIRNMAWEELEKKASSWSENISPIEDAIVVSDDELPAVEDKRHKLLELLKKKPAVPETVSDDSRPITPLDKVIDTKKKGGIKKDRLAEEEERKAKRKAYWQEWKRKQKEKGKEAKNDPTN